VSKEVGMTASANAGPKKYARMAEFYPFYLSEHANRTSRRLHFIGTTLGLAWLVSAAAALNPWFLLGGLITGYAFAWVGHFFFEKNRPATFQYPLYSFAGDWVMWSEILRGKIKF
jgi:hypothetical protein